MSQIWFQRGKLQVFALAIYLLLSQSLVDLPLLGAYFSALLELHLDN